MFHTPLHFVNITEGRQHGQMARHTVHHHLRVHLRVVLLLPLLLLALLVALQCSLVLKQGNAHCLHLLLLSVYQLARMHVSLSAWFKFHATMPSYLPCLTVLTSCMLLMVPFHACFTRVQMQQVSSTCITAARNIFSYLTTDTAAVTAATAAAAAVLATSTTHNSKNNTTTTTTTRRAAITAVYTSRRHKCCSAGSADQ
jgi:hypothetical protein